MVIEHTPSRAASPALSVVVPCYNDGEGLAEFHRQATVAFTAVVGSDYEIIFVNDGSRDGTAGVMARLAADDPRVVAIDLTRNFGHQAAITAGLEYSAGQRILTIDSDLQDPPGLIGEMMSLMDRGADVVYGQRRAREGEVVVKKAVKWLFYRQLRWLTDIDIPVDTGDFRLITRRVCDTLLAMPEHHRFVRGMVSWIGLKQVPLLYDRPQRFAGESGYSLRRLVALALDGITGFSIVPLKIASFVGLVMGVVSMCMLAYSIGSWLFRAPPAGWTSQTTIILVIGSVQLMVLGIIGEYLGRLYMQTKQRPLYLVGSIVRRFPAESSAPPARQDQARRLVGS